MITKVEVNKADSSRSPFYPTSKEEENLKEKNGWAGGKNSEAKSKMEGMSDSGALFWA